MDDDVPLTRGFFIKFKDGSRIQVSPSDNRMSFEMFCDWLEELCEEYGPETEFAIESLGTSSPLKVEYKFMRELVTFALDEAEAAAERSVSLPFALEGQAAVAVA